MKGAIYPSGDGGVCQVSWIQVRSFRILLICHRSWLWWCCPILDLLSCVWLCVWMSSGGRWQRMNCFGKGKDENFDKKLCVNEWGTLYIDVTFVNLYFNFKFPIWMLFCMLMRSGGRWWSAVAKVRHKLNSFLEKIGTLKDSNQQNGYCVLVFNH